MWYDRGLRFACTQCGNCCRGSGTVRVSESEIAALARLLGLTEAEFRAIYTLSLRDGDVSLRERANTDCIFWNAERGCTVYEERPRQCRTWPFWDASLRSAESWGEQARDCPGMNHGPLHEARDILALAENDGTFGGRNR